LTLLVLCVITLIQGCATLGLVKAVMPGNSGTDVNANAQVGKENTQQVVANQQNTKIEGENVNVSQKETDTSINTSKVDSLVQNNTNVPMWYLLLLVLGWLLPSPQEIWAGFVSSMERLLYGKKPNKRKTKKK
jgi:Na+/glutamate symporter